MRFALFGVRFCTIWRSIFSRLHCSFTFCSWDMQVVGGMRRLTFAFPNVLMGKLASADLPGYAPAFPRPRALRLKCFKFSPIWGKRARREWRGTKDGAYKWKYLNIFWEAHVLGKGCNVVGANGRKGKRSRWRWNQPRLYQNMHAVETTQILYSSRYKYL